jgi:tetratricopeptide (TPR) repeat protein
MSGASEAATVYYAQAGRFDDAIKSFREALSRRPDYALARGNLGRILLIKGDVAEALKEYQEAVRIDPGNPQNLLGLSEAYAARGAYDLALEAIERAMKLPLSEGLAKEIFAKRAEYQKRRAPNQR